MQWQSAAPNLRQGTHLSAAVLQQDVDVLLVLEMVVKVHDVFVVQRSVQLDFSVNLAENNNNNKQRINKRVTKLRL